MVPVVSEQSASRIRCIFPIFLVSCLLICLVSFLVCLVVVNRFECRQENRGKHGTRTISWALHRGALHSRANIITGA